MEIAEIAIIADIFLILFQLKTNIARLNDAACIFTRNFQMQNK
jgi:hypothetical protein